MDNEKLAKIGLGLGAIAMGVLACLSVSELAHNVRVHSLERKLYKQEIKLNNELIKYVDKIVNKHKFKFRVIYKPYSERRRMDYE